MPAGPGFDSRRLRTPSRVARGARSARLGRGGGMEPLASTSLPRSRFAFRDQVGNCRDLHPMRGPLSAPAHRQRRSPRRGATRPVGARFAARPPAAPRRDPRPASRTRAPAAGSSHRPRRRRTQVDEPRGDRRASALVLARVGEHVVEGVAGFPGRGEGAGVVAVGEHAAAASRMAGRPEAEHRTRERESEGRAASNHGDQAERQRREPQAAAAPTRVAPRSLRHR